MGPGVRGELHKLAVNPTPGIEGGSGSHLETQDVEMLAGQSVQAGFLLCPTLTNKVTDLFEFKLTAFVIFHISSNANVPSY